MHLSRREGSEHAGCRGVRRRWFRQPGIMRVCRLRGGRHPRGSVGGRLFDSGTSPPPVKGSATTRSLLKLVRAEAELGDVHTLEHTGGSALGRQCHFVES